MADFVKHRQEREVYAVDFAALLSQGETLSSPSVTITALNATTDVTAQFRSGEPDPVVSGTEVQFWLKAASAGEQREGQYYILVKVTTSQARVLTALRSSNVPVTLKVVDDGDVA